MNTNLKRRTLLKGSLGTGVFGALVGAGLLTPQALLAAWPEKAFKATTVDDAITALAGSSGGITPSEEITIKAPEIAENGAVVPVTVSTTLKDVESITIIAEKNKQPLIATFELAAGAVPFASTRIKMGKTSNVLALVKAGGKLYSARQEVKVTIGGCGG